MVDDRAHVDSAKTFRLDGNNIRKMGTIGRRVPS